MSMWFLKKLRIDLPQEPAIPLLGMYPKDAQEHLLYAHSSFIHNNQKPQTTQMYLNWTMWHIYTMEYYLAARNNGTMKSAGEWMEQGKIILDEVTQTQKDKHGIYSLVNGY